METHLPNEEEEGSSSSTDVDANVEDDDIFDVEFFKCYSALKRKDGKIYDQNFKFFERNAHSSSGSEDDERKGGGSKMTLLDHQLAVNPEEIEEDDSFRGTMMKSFYEKELEEIKKSIKKVGEDVDSESGDDLLVVKGSNQGPRHKLNSIIDKVEGQEDEDLQYLKKVWSDPDKLPEEDRFLRDYILNKRYLDKSNEDDEDADDESDEDRFFSKNIDELSDADDEQHTTQEKRQVVLHHSDEKDFHKIARVPRNSTKTIRDMVEKQEKKEKRLKKLEKEKKKKKVIKDADCEDLVGGLSMKFQYRETEPNDYGLTAEELLMATDEELDKWVSLRDCIAYKTPEEEKAEKEKFESRKTDIELKKSIFKSIYGGQTDQAGGELADQSAIDVQSTTNKKRMNKKRKKDVESESSYKESANSSVQEQTKPLTDKGTGDVPESNRQRKKRKKRRGLNHKKFSSLGVAPDRLLAYGISKTRLKKSKIL